jgi:hypothetical protein
MRSADSGCMHADNCTVFILIQQLQYLRHGDRGILLFGATLTVIRNGRVCEAPFDVQREVISRGEPGVTMPSSLTNAAATTSYTAASQHQQVVSGHTVATQVSGYRWLPQLAADALGCRALPLQALVGVVAAKAVCSDIRVRKAVSLVAEVAPMDGGRQVCCCMYQQALLHKYCDHIVRETAITLSLSLTARLWSHSTLLACTLLRFGDHVSTVKHTLCT